MNGLGSTGDAPDGADPQAAAHDWITIWQSELTALATDREAQETCQELWRRLVALWAEAAGSAFGALSPAGGPSGTAPAPHERADGSAGTALPPRPAAAPAAPDPRDLELARLRARVDELEQRLGAVERGRGSGGPAKSRRGGSKQAS